MRDLKETLAAAMKRVAAMSAEERDAMFKAQRESYVRGMTTPCEHGVLDFEQCGACRGEHRESDDARNVD